MQIEHIREFLTLSETLSFGETAKRMFITQSALSRHISSMEDEISVKLFVRNPHGVELTQAGAAFAKHAHKILRSYEVALNEAIAAESGKKKAIHIGYLFDAMRETLPSITSALKQDDSIEAYYSAFEYGSLMTELRKERIDVALTLDLKLGDMPGIVFAPIESDRYMFVVAKSHPLAQKDSISLAEIRREAVITPNIEIMGKRLNRFFCQIVSENGAHPFNDEKHYSDIPSLAYQVESGEGVSLMFSHHQKRYENIIRFVPIEDDIPTADFAFAWLQEVEDSAEKWPETLRVLAKRLSMQ